MTRTITAITQPVQVHAHALQIIDSRSLLWLTAQQPNAGEAETLPRRRQGMQVIGMRTTQTDHARCASSHGLLKMGFELEPFVAGQQRIDKIEPQAGELDTRSFEPGQTHALQRRRRAPVGNA